MKNHSKLIMLLMVLCVLGFTILAKAVSIEKSYYQSSLMASLQPCSNELQVNYVPRSANDIASETRAKILDGVISGSGDQFSQSARHQGVGRTIIIPIPTSWDVTIMPIPTQWDVQIIFVSPTNSVEQKITVPGLLRLTNSNCSISIGLAGGF